MPVLTIAAITAALAGAAVTGISAWRASKDAKKARDFQEAHSDEITKLLNELEAPNFNRPLTPNEIEMLSKIPKLGEFIARDAPDSLPFLAGAAPTLVQHIAENEPHVARFIQEQSPETIESLIEGSEQGREAQEKALAELMKVGTEGDVIGESERIRAMDSISQQEAGQRGALTEEMARRGQLGSGRELLMKLAGQQAAGQQAAQAGMQSFEDAQRRRLEALSQVGALGTKIFDQDVAIQRDNVAIERDNVAIINAFNQRNTEAMRRIEEQAVADRNARIAREAQARRGVESQNVEAANRFQDAETQARREAERLNWMAQEDYKREETEAQRQRQREEDILRQQQARDAKDLTLSERARQDDISQLEYENELNKIRTKQGIGDSQSAANFQSAEAQRQAAGQAGQAVSQAAGTAFDAWDRYDQRRRKP